MIYSGRISIPEPVEYILKKLNDAGHEAYAVGGCIRDAILGRTPNDWDITTSALPEQVKALFRRTIDTGIQHGTVTVLLREGTFEVTTYRIDGIYEDSRHPKDVTFTSDLTEDLRRRDFTINAMAYHPAAGLADPYNGLADLESRTIRAVGDPYARFDEDALRILRAIRFAGQLGFTIEPETLAAIDTFAPRLQLISAERIQTELTKLLSSAHPDYLQLATDAGISAVILPELYRQSPEVQAAVMRAMTLTAPKHTLRLALLLSAPDTDADAASTDAEQRLRALKYDNDTIAAVKQLVRYRDYGFDPDLPGTRTAIYNVGGDLFPDYLDYLHALAAAGLMTGLTTADTNRIADQYKAVTEAGDCITLKQLALTGGDLIALGVAPGKEMGRILHEMLMRVHRDPSLNTRGSLTEMLSEIISL